MRLFARVKQAFLNPSRLELALLTLGLVGLLLRLWLWHASEGCNDIRTWRLFGRTGDQVGLGTTYVLLPGFNHPPLMGWLGIWAHRLSLTSELSFAQLFKLPVLLAELITALLLLDAWRQKGRRELGARAFAAYGLSIGAILISAYHGNTDALYFCFSFLAMYLLEARRAVFLAGLALGAALNVKLIPIVLVAPLATRCRDLKELLKYGLGVGVGVLPYAVAYLGYFTPLQREHFVSNVFGYKSQADIWGIEMVAHALSDALTRGSPVFALRVRSLGNWYILHGGRCLLLVSALLAVWQWLSRRKLDAYELGALGYCAFLGFASGFGIQYVGCVLPPLLACAQRDALKVSLATGIFILLVYVNYVRTYDPIYSEHGLVPIIYGGFSSVAWLSVVVAGIALVARSVSPGTEPPRTGS